MNTVANFLLDVDELGALLEWHKSRPVPDRDSIIAIKRAIEDIHRAEAYNSRFPKKDSSNASGEANQEEVIVQ